MLSKQLEATLQLALSIANNNHHEYTTIEHLLLALLEDADAYAILRAHSIDVEEIRKALENYISYELVALRREGHHDSRPTAGFQRVVHRAAIHGNATGINNITGAHLLAEIFFEHESFAVSCLKERNLSRMDVIDSMSSHPTSRLFSLPHESSPLTGGHTAAIYNIKPQQNSQINQGATKTEPSDFEIFEASMEAYCVNLNNKAKQGGIDLLIGREKEIQRCIEILCRRQKNNAILVGEPGVGKTAIAEGLALRIVNKEVPLALQDFTVYAIDFGGMVAGARYRGDFEERIKELIQKLKAHGKAILFIDEIHTMIGAGSTAGSSLDASNLLKPALARGELRCIGSTTFKEYKNHFEKDAALVRRFQKIIVDEPDDDTALKILYGLKPHYEKHHGVIYENGALEAAVYLSKRYITDRLLPDKAIDLMDESGARKKISGSLENIVTAKDIESIVAMIAHLPHVMIASDEAKQIKQLQRNLRTVIFGQNAAINELCSSIKLAKAGLRSHDKPTGCYLFVGPTGVGKTELAKQLARFCNMKLLRFDMSEYSESHAVSRLIGSPPGYVGFDQGGLLTEAVDRSPYAVVLFDEIEKANPEIFNLLLQVMDYGKLTDSTGKAINFTHSIIIMTSNLGSGEKSRTRIGFEGEQEEKEVEEAVDISAITQSFSEEFCSRLDSIIAFNSIDTNIVGMIVDKELKVLEAQLADKGVKLTTEPSVKTYLAHHAINNKNGARAISRMIDLEIKQKIADEMLFGKLTKGGNAHITCTKKALNFEFHSSKESKQKLGV
ncbi:MAG: AAA family ATPase [Pseudomonadota bacterium]